MPKAPPPSISYYNHTFQRGHVFRTRFCNKNRHVYAWSKKNTQLQNKAKQGVAFISHFRQYNSAGRKFIAWVFALIFKATYLILIFVFIFKCVFDVDIDIHTHFHIHIQSHIHMHMHIQFRISKMHAKTIKKYKKHI